MRSLDDFMSLAVYCRDRMNPYLFIYALSVAILHRPDTKNLPIPSLSEVFPDKFIDGALFEKAKEESNIVPEKERVSPNSVSASTGELIYFNNTMSANSILIFQATYCHPYGLQCDGFG